MLWVEIINQHLTNMLSNKMCQLYDSFCYVSLIFLWSKLSNSAPISDYPINSQSFSVPRKITILSSTLLNLENIHFLFCISFIKKTLKIKFKNKKDWDHHIPLHIAHIISVLAKVDQSSASQTLWSQDLFTFLKIIKDSQRAFVYVGYTYPYLSYEKLKETFFNTRIRKDTFH